MRACRVECGAESKDAYPCSADYPEQFWSNGLLLSREWFRDNLGKQIEAFHLVGDQGAVIGHIYWSPSNRALAPYDIEDGVAYVYCEWIRAAHRGEGGMRMIFEEFADYLHREGFKGILVSATTIDEFMHERHFLKRGFTILRETENGKLLYYPINKETIWVEPKHSRVTREGNASVNILVLGSHFCPIAASTVLSLRKVALEKPDSVHLREVDADRQSIEQYGVAEGIYINGKPVFMGPVDEETVRQTIRKEEYRVLDARRAEIQ